MIEDNIINKEENERTVLVGLSTRAQDETRTAEYLDELAFLAETAGAEPVARFTQRLASPNKLASLSSTTNSRRSRWPISRRN